MTSQTLPAHVTRVLRHTNAFNSANHRPASVPPIRSASTVACVSSRSQPHVIKMVKSRFIVDCMGRRLDVAFVLDSSKSVEEKNWEKIVDFVALMTHKMALENGLQRAGLLISIQTQRVILIFFDPNAAYSKFSMEDRDFLLHTCRCRHVRK